MRAHGDVTALAHTFLEVISAKEMSPRPLRELRNRCLNPGLYHQHIDRWLNFYEASQVEIDLILNLS